MIGKPADVNYSIRMYSSQTRKSLTSLELEYWATWFNIRPRIWSWFNFYDMKDNVRLEIEQQYRREVRR
jgi:hypothetical protein